MKIVYITLAKKDSIRFPNKNRLLCQYTFNFMKGIKNYYVISNDFFLLNLANNIGFKIIHEPDELATNEIEGKTLMNWMHSKIKSDIYVMLPFTSPKRDFKLMKKYLRIFIKSGLNSMCSICKTSRENHKLSGAYWFFRKEQLLKTDIIDFETMYFNSIFNYDIDTKEQYDEFMEYMNENKNNS